MNENSEERDRSESMDDTNGSPVSRSKLPWLIVAIAFGIVLISVATFFIIRQGAPGEQQVAETEKNEAGTVKFLMEQQWLIRMKLATAEEQTVSRQISSVGRVTPAANSQAIVSTPVAGVLSERQLPRIGQYVRGGQPVAVIRQTATSAEQAQTRAAIVQAEVQRAQIQSQNAQINVENARLESEKRTAAGDAETSRIRLDSARREADRVQRLFEGKAASDKQLQAARAERDS